MCLNVRCELNSLQNLTFGGEIYIFIIEIFFYAEQKIKKLYISVLLRDESSFYIYNLQLYQLTGVLLHAHDDICFCTLQLKTGFCYMMNLVTYNLQLNLCFVTQRLNSVHVYILTCFFLTEEIQKVDVLAATEVVSSDPITLNVTFDGRSVDRSYLPFTMKFL